MSSPPSSCAPSSCMPSSCAPSSCLPTEFLLTDMPRPSFTSEKISAETYGQWAQWEMALQERRVKCVCAREEYIKQMDETIARLKKMEDEAHSTLGSYRYTLHTKQIAKGKIAQKNRLMQIAPVAEFMEFQLQNDILQSNLCQQLQESTSMLETLMVQRQLMDVRRTRREREEIFRTECPHENKDGTRIRVDSRGGLVDEGPSARTYRYSYCQDPDELLKCVICNTRFRKSCDCSRCDRIG